MRNGLIGLVSAMVLASTMATAACSDYSSEGGTGGTASTMGGSSSSGGNGPSTGGQQSTGGATTGGSSAATGGSSAATGGSSSNCSDVTPCGGDVVGTWKVTSSCLKVTGQVDLTTMGIGCTSASLTGGSLQVTGTWTANSDGTYLDDTTTSGDEQFTLAAACLNVSGTTTTCDGLARSFGAVGFTSPACTPASGGCTCQASVEQSGGIGVVSVTASTSNTYTTSGNVVTISDGRKGTPYQYCVSGSTLTMTPKTTGTTTTGTIVLQKQ